MTDGELLTALLDQIGTWAEGVQAVMESQQVLSSKLDEQAASLAAIGVAVGMTYLSTGSDKPLPIDVLEDRAFARFLENYPLDGPPIVGKVRSVADTLWNILRCPSVLLIAVSSFGRKPN